MRFSLLLACLSVLAVGCSSPTPAYDLVIQGGLVYDGSGGEPYVADIGLRGDSIAAIGQKLGAAERRIDARGMAVAPGFINMLSWANESLLIDGRAQSDLRQGVTLEVMGEGRSMGPLTPRMKQEMRQGQQELKYDIPWTTLGEYLTHLEDRGVAVNVASFVGNGTLRTHVIGYADRPATPREMEEMKSLLAHAMAEGAMGLSSSLLYSPSMHADTEELTELARVAADYDGMYVSHIRDEGDELFEAIGEFMSICRDAKVRSEIYHLKASGADNWWKMDSVIRWIDRVRDEGLPVTADMYTYNASSTGLHVQLPQWVRKEGIDEMLTRLDDPATRARVEEEIRFRNPPESILFVGFKNKDLRRYAGRRLDEVATERGVTPARAVIDLIREDRSRIQVVYFSMSEENIDRKIQQPWMSFCSDAGAYSAEGAFLAQSTHPRAYGSFIRVLGHFSRDKGLFPLEEGIRRLSALPAENLRLARRGHLKVGHFADIVVFDPAEVRDNATFADPHQYATGVRDVVVNGCLSLHNGEPTGNGCGRFVKGPGAAGSLAP
ncbi:N-acyl-D-amino-acid deacylase [Lewinella marina]|uniref:Aminoacylase n=1 Tax=Neolewinella marina TaxID=438751 RepID=A0A2G0CCY9_9BACT|nr:D-aminoacylase [Neolewinella marina]NJB86963.1 N-acyl-D-amino-acid deacylase [Neolewinella marina]PHK97841.1 aminoacylase [Neolewinella marina]